MVRAYLSVNLQAHQQRKLWTQKQKQVMSTNKKLQSLKQTHC